MGGARAVRAVLKLLDSFGNALLGGGGDVHFIPAAVGNDGSGGEGTLRQRGDIFEGGHGQAPFAGRFFLLSIGQKTKISSKK